MRARANQPPRRGAAQAARRPAPRGRAPARIPAPGIGAQLGRAVQALPIAPETWARIRRWTLGLFILAGIGAGVVAMGLPQMAGLTAAHALGSAGFVVRNIEIAGRTHVDRDAVYRVVMDARGQDMPLVDLAELRRALLSLGWVQDARVSRRLPDTLVVDIVERQPAAIWQYRQRLSLIDAAGQPIAAVPVSAAPEGLPVLIGPGANLHAAELARLVGSQPSMRPLVRDATWIGDRRWDLRFVSGELLSLPEGEDAARSSLAWFARKDSEVRLLGQGIVRFDLRDPTHMVVRMSGEPGARVDQPAQASAQTDRQQRQPATREAATAPSPTVL